MGGRRARRICSCNMMRNGRRDEGYFSFSYRPIPEDDGSIGGVFCPVVETTERVIGERRLRTLRDLAALSRAEDEAQACRLAASVLAVNGDDIPFSAIYRLDEAQGEAELMAAPACRRARASLRAHSARRSRSDRGDIWGLAEVARLTPAASPCARSTRASACRRCGPWSRGAGRGRAVSGRAARPGSRRRGADRRRQSVQAARRRLCLFSRSRRGQDRLRHDRRARLCGGARARRGDPLARGGVAAHRGGAARGAAARPHRQLALERTALRPRRRLSLSRANFRPRSGRAATELRRAEGHALRSRRLGAARRRRRARRCAPAKASSSICRRIASTAPASSSPFAARRCATSAARSSACAARFRTSPNARRRRSASSC